MEASRAALPATGVRQIVGDYFTLTKPKVQLLLLLTTITTMYVAGDPSLGLVAVAVIGGFLSAGGAGAFNHWYDRDIDAAMARTADAPGPGRAHLARAALVYAFALQIAGFVILTVGANLLAAFLALAGFVWYTVVYTMWLKRRSPQNIVIGGAAGAVPPLVGWAAVTGSRRPRRAVPVRDRLLLDAAALLGAQPADEGRVRARRRADDAGRARRGGDAPPDRPLHAAADRPDAAAVRVRLLRRHLRRRRRRPGRRVHHAGHPAAARRRPRQRPAHLPVLPQLPRDPVRRDGRSTLNSRLPHRWIASSHAETSGPPSTPASSGC